MSVKIKDDFYLNLYEKLDNYRFIPYIFGFLLSIPLLYYIWIHQNENIITRFNLVMGYVYLTFCLSTIYFGFNIMDYSATYAKNKSEAYKLGMKAYPTTCILNEIHFQNKYFKKAFCDGYLQMIIEHGFNDENKRFRII